MPYSTPVVLDGETQFESIKDAARFAYHNGWATSFETAYHLMKRAVQGVDHRLYGHEWKKGVLHGRVHL